MESPKPMKCSHCGQRIPTKDILSWAARLSSKKRTTWAGAERVERPCPYGCRKEPFGTRELVAHLAEGCPKAPAKGNRGRPPILKTCKYCKKRMPTVVWLIHEPSCPERPLLQPQH